MNKYASDRIGYDAYMPGWPGYPDGLRERLAAPWFSAIIAIIAAMPFAFMLNPEGIPFWSTWLGFGTVSLLFALTGMWASRVPPFAFLAGLLLALCLCVAPIYCWWNPDVLDDFYLTSSFPQAWVFNQLCCGFYCLALIMGTAGAPAARDASFDLSPSNVARLVRWSKCVYLAGSVLAIGVPFAPSGGLAFAYYLLLQLRHVALCVLILISPERMAGRWVLIGICVQCVDALSGQLTELVYNVATYILCLAFRLKSRTVFFIAGLGLVVLVVPLQAAKDKYREAVWFSGRSYSTVERFFLVGECVRETFENVTTGEHQGWLGPFMVRMNHVRIVEAVFNNVPDNEPFARGETIWGILQTTLNLKLLDPEKELIGGRTSFTRFTGHPLHGDTSMDIGLTGEAYANFGFAGGLIYFAVLMVLVAFGLRRWTVWAQRRPLAWVWFPYLFYFAVTVANTLADSVNFAVKAAVVMACVVCLEPAWRAALFGRQPAGRHGESAHS